MGDRAVVVVLTYSASGELRRVEWFEDEARCYAGDPFRLLVFNPVACVWTGRTMRTCPSREANVDAAMTLWRLTRNPWADVSDIATHYSPEPGAPLEPIPFDRTLGGAA